MCGWGFEPNDNRIVHLVGHFRISRKSRRNVTLIVVVVVASGL